MDIASLRRHRFTSPDSYETYHISLIDYLQQWNTNKKSERFLKTTFLGKKGEELSAVEPVFYQYRFVRVLNSRIITICETELRRASTTYSINKGVDFQLEMGPHSNSREPAVIGKVIHPSLNASLSSESNLQHQLELEKQEEDDERS